MKTVLLGLGSNLGNRLAHLQAAITALRQCKTVQILTISPVYETPPWGAAGTPPYLNAAVLITTTLSLEILLDNCLNIESALGRVRDTNNQFAPRTVDIDILLAHDESNNLNLFHCDIPNLIVPHPRLALRAFALKPALDIWHEQFSRAQLIAWYNSPIVQLDTINVVETTFKLY